MKLPPGANLLPNGDVFVSNRGGVPKSNLLGPDYEQDIENPNLFKLKWCDCKYKDMEGLTKRLPCGKFKKLPFCKLKSIQINAKICQMCKEGKQGWEP